MTNEQAQVIMSIDPLHWQTVIDLIEEDRKVIAQSLDDPGNPRDLDQYHKGGRAFGLQVIEYREMAYKILHPQKEKEE